MGTGILKTWMLLSSFLLGGVSGTAVPTHDSAPAITSLSPSFGYVDLNTTVQIVGSNFQSGATVLIGQTAATDVSVNGSNTLTATIGAGLTSGTYDVTVTNPDAQSAVLSGGFEAVSSPNEWTKVTLSGLPKPVTSTCTILLPDSLTYRMYFTATGAIRSYTSTDGVGWGNGVTTGITDPGGTNPSVIRLRDGTYLMIYGIQTANPMAERLYRATSTDGITFTKQAGPLTGGAVLIADAGENDFVSVPELIYLNDTTLRLYFVASTAVSRIHTATSTDNGQTWTREGQISITGGSYGGQTNDPDVVRLADGRWRLFFATPPAGKQIGELEIRSAISTDGRNFTLESGTRISPWNSFTVTMDPDAVLAIGSTDTYRLYYGVEPAGDLQGLLSLPDVPSQPELLSPADGAVGVVAGTRLVWASSVRATSYRVQVSQSADFSSTTIDLAGVTDTSYAVAGLDSNASYYWRVNATNEGGTSPYAVRRLFATVMAAPTAPVLISPSDNATGISTSPTLSWNASSGATLYHLQVSENQGFSPTVVNDSTITDTMNVIGPLQDNTTYYWRVRAKNGGGWGEYSASKRFSTLQATSVEQDVGGIPSAYSLSQNYPNPFNPATAIRFSLPKESRVSLKVFDLLGREVATLVSRELGPGSFTIRWHADVPSGMYIYRLRCGEFVSTKKMILLQ
jgi:hypothetical protein